MALVKFPVLRRFFFFHHFYLVSILSSLVSFGQFSHHMYVQLSLGLIGICTSSNFVKASHVTVYEQSADVKLILLLRPRSHLLYGEDMAAVRPLN